MCARACMCGGEKGLRVMYGEQWHGKAGARTLPPVAKSPMGVVIVLSWVVQETLQNQPSHLLLSPYSSKWSHFWDQDCTEEGVTTQAWGGDMMLQSVIMSPAPGPTLFIYSTSWRTGLGPSWPQPSFAHL